MSCCGVESHDVGDVGIVYILRLVLILLCDARLEC